MRRLTGTNPDPSVKIVKQVPTCKTCPCAMCSIVSKTFELRSRLDRLGTRPVQTFYKYVGRSGADMDTAPQRYSFRRFFKGAVQWHCLRFETGKARPSLARPCPTNGVDRSEDELHGYCAAVVPTSAAITRSSSVGRPIQTFFPSPHR